MSQGGRRFGLFALMLLVSATCVGLGLWQGRRLTARRSANQVALAARALPEVDLNEIVINQALPGRRIQAQGIFDYSSTFILRGRVEREVPGVQIVVPLRLEGRPEAILVNRGFVPAHDAARPDTSTIDRTAELTVSGLALPIPSSADSGGPLVYGEATTWRRLDLAAVKARLPYPVLDVYLHETEPEMRAEGASRWPAPAQLPPLDDGPHLSYMIQWFGIAAVALGFGVAVLRRQTMTDDDRRRQTKTDDDGR